MKQYLLSILIGIIIGTIDILPMILRKLDKMFIFSAFSMWLIAGILITKTDFTSYGFLNGIILASLLALPLLFLIIRLDRNAIPQIIITTIFLGALLGFSNNYFLTKL